MSPASSLADIVLVKKAVANFFMNASGVNGVDVGYKYVNGIKTEEISIRIFVSEKTDNISEEYKIPSVIAGIKTDIIEQQGLMPYIDNGKYRPLLGGCRISSSIKGDTIPGGTLGCVAYDELNAKYVVLSNYHVVCYVDEDWNVGDPVAQPHITHEDHLVGTISRAVLSNYVDAAIVNVNPGINIKKTILEIGDIKGSRTAVLGSHVRQRGAYSDLSYGIIDGLAGSNTVHYGGAVGDRVLEDVINIAPDLEHNEDFSFGGDSGAVLVDEDNYVVGLHFGGSGSNGAACSISHVLSELNISIHPTVEPIDPEFPGEPGGDMATVTAFTAERSQAIEDNAVVNGSLAEGNLILTKGNGDSLDLGAVGGGTGEPGPPGAVGTPWLTGSGAPSSGVGVLDQFYLDSASGSYYQKGSPDWTLKGSLKGSTGPAGIDGTGELLVNRITTDATVNPLRSDVGSIVFCNRATAISLNIQEFEDVAIDVPVGGVIAYKQVGLGTVFVSYGAGVILDVTNGVASAYTRAQNSIIWLYHESLNHWSIGGDFTEDAGD